VPEVKLSVIAADMHGEYCACVSSMGVVLIDKGVLVANGFPGQAL
jgi:hypothetical protein